MTRVLLIRHGSGPHVGRVLAGRAPGVSLDPLGQAQAERLAGYLETLGADVLYATPMERARQTAEPIAQRLGIGIRESAAFTEVEYGDWTGVQYASLGDNDRWQHWNRFRSGTRVPGGETMLEVQLRTVNELLRWRDEHRDATVAIVAHGDPIRAAIAHVLGIPLDLAHRLAIDPASVSELQLHDWGVAVQRVNDTRAG